MGHEPLRVSAEQARSFILARQGLLAPLPSPTEVVRAVVGVQTQYALSLPIAVAARSKVPARWEENALNKRRELAKLWTLRFTLHVHAAEDRDLLLSAIGPDKYARYLHWMHRSRGLGKDQLEPLLDSICEALATRPMTRQEIHERVEALRGLPGAGWGLDVMGLAFQGRIVLAPAGQGPTRFALASDWLGCTGCWKTDPDEAYAELLRRYLHAHGPATLADFTYWVGCPVARSREALKRVMPELVEVEVEGMKGKRYILAQDERMLTGELPKQKVSLLAKFDPLIMGWKDKSLFLPEKYNKNVIRPAGQIEATVLAKGQVAGAWRLDRKGTRGVVRVQPFRKLTKAELAAIEKRAAVAGKALGLKDVHLLPDSSFL